MAVKKGALGHAIARGKKAAPKPKSTSAILSLDQIKDRPHGDTRTLNAQHVQELLESIAAVGLIQPLAVDATGHLLAGGHRRAAITLLSQLASGETDTEAEQSQDYYAEAWTQHFSKGIPVHRFGFDSTAEADRAIAIEAAENEKRRDYTPDEVRELADRLVNAGYKETSGRPKKGERALTPALMTIVGKSKRTIRKYLAGEEHQSKKMVQSCTIRERAIKQLRHLQEHPDLEGDVHGSELITKSIELLQAIDLPN